MSSGGDITTLYAHVIQDATFLPKADCRTRLDVLVALVTINLFACILFAVTRVTRTRRAGQDCWAIRIVRRPQGRYLLANQFVCSAVLASIQAIVWLPYLLWLRRHANQVGFPAQLATWFALNTIPSYCWAWMVTCSLLSWANLVATCKKRPFKDGQPQHMFGPRTANFPLLVVFPVTLVLVLAFAIRSAVVFESLVQKLNVWLEDLGNASRTWNSLSSAQQDSFAIILVTKYHDVEQARHAYNTTHQQWTITILVGFCLCVLVNVLGAVTILRSIRIKGKTLFAKGEAIVHPLGPFQSTNDQSELVTETRQISKSMTDVALFESFRPVALPRRDSRDERDSSQLPWHVIILFCSVCPTSVFFLAFYAVIAATVSKMTPSSSIMEFALLGQVWAGTCTLLVTNVALLIREISLIANPRSVAESNPSNMQDVNEEFPISDFVRRSKRNAADDASLADMPSFRVDSFARIDSRPTNVYSKDSSLAPRVDPPRTSGEDDGQGKS